MNWRRNDVVLLPFPFTDLSGRKVRPAVVLGGNIHGDVFLVPITTQAHGIAIQLAEWRAAGLNVPCGIKAQIATVEVSLVLKRVGILSRSDVTKLDAALKQWLSLS